LVTFKKYLDFDGTTANGCFNLSQSVEGAVVFFLFSDEDWCTAVSRCNKAANAGAIGCLFYDTADTIGFAHIFSVFLSSQL
jgi:hypothetical protein